MKERPIIFTSEMVRAILEGRKTQTRRLIKLPNYTGGTLKINKDMNIDLMELMPHGYSKLKTIRCPYGQPGHRLWVRETYSISGNGVFYKTDTDSTVHIAWIPAIFMPRKYSRIILEITNIRVEKLCKISIEDANAEGFLSTNECLESMIFGFSQYWDSINRKYPWRSNPWVWVINFYRLNSH